MKKVIIIDYKMGNVASVQKAFSKIGAEALITNDSKKIYEAEFIILPGVGAFGDGIKNLKELSLIEILEKKVVREKTPFLGICLGMQLLADRSNEFGIHPGLGWISGDVMQLRVPKNYRLPHIGWNDVIVQNNHSWFNGIHDNNFYFVHSFHLMCKKDVIAATCDYGEVFAAAIQKENIFGTQFHPEKSQTGGLTVLKNFLNYQNHA